MSKSSSNSRKRRSPERVTFGEVEIWTTHPNLCINAETPALVVMGSPRELDGGGGGGFLASSACFASKLNGVGVEEGDEGALGTTGRRRGLGPPECVGVLICEPRGGGGGGGALLCSTFRSDEEDAVLSNLGLGLGSLDAELARGLGLVGSGASRSKCPTDDGLDPPLLVDTLTESCSNFERRVLTGGTCSSSTSPVGCADISGDVRRHCR